MRSAIILHGTDGKPDSNWFPWLKGKLESAGYRVWVPLLPGNHTPNRQVYNDFIFNSGRDFTDGILIGHSSGAVSVLNMLMDARCPKVNLAVVVSAWKGGIPQGYEPDNKQFENLFPPDGFDFELIKKTAGKIAFLHSDNDPHCPIKQAEFLAEQLDASLTVVHVGLHLGDNFTVLPELWNIIKPNLAGNT